MKNYIIFGVVAVLVVVAAVVYEKKQNNTAVAPAAVVEEQPIASSTGTVVTQSKPITMANGLIIEDVKIGTGAEAVKGALISVHYVGTLVDGKKFDSSRDRGEPFQFPLGQGMVIQGWEQGFEGMKVGGVRKLTIPPDLGYGAQGAGGVIPPNATLKFEVELLGVRLK
jgi:FKBP-type peptidyl-prolyl cis-trans isomerase